MALKIELKPYERIVVGNAIITNEGERARFVIDGDVAILREKFIMKEEQADTPSKRLYYIVLQLYLNNESRNVQNLYIKYVSDLQKAAPSLIEEISKINHYVLMKQYYKAINASSLLVKKEKELFKDLNK